MSEDKIRDEIEKYLNQYHGSVEIYKNKKLVETVKYRKIITEDVGDFKIGKTAEEKEYEIISYNGFDKDIVIPSEINGKKIIGITNEAFKQNSLITSVKIENGIERIGKESFYGCEQLVSVTLPDTLKSIGKEAFGRCSIEEIVLPDFLEKVEKSCFTYCSNLKYAKLPENMETVPEGMFEKCCNLTNVVFPKNVKIIEDSAFVGCPLNIDNVPATVKKLGEKAFDGCEIEADELRLPDGLEDIGEQALGNIIVEKLYIPKSVQYIGDHFITSSIEEVYIEPGCTVGCGKLDLFVTEKYYIPKSITNISGITSFSVTRLVNLIDSKQKHPEFQTGLTIEELKKMLDNEVEREIKALKNLVIYCEPGSTAQKYAMEEKIKAEKYDFN